MWANCCNSVRAHEQTGAKKLERLNELLQPARGHEQKLATLDSNTKRCNLISDPGEP